MANLGVVRSITQVGKYEPFELQVARGQITGHEVVNVFGYASAVSTSFVSVWENNAAYVFPTVASTMVVSSSSASDTAVSVQIFGLDADYNRITEVVALNGTNNVATTKVYWRINNVITTAGAAVGTMYVKNAGGTTYAQITIGSGKTNMSVYTVPAGYTAYLTQFDGFSSTSVTSGVFATFRGLLTSSTGISNVVLQAPFLNTYSVTRPYPIPVLEKVDLQLQCKSSGAGLGIGVLGIGVLIANNISGTVG
jgi:hypothetical protein